MADLIPFTPMIAPASFGMLACLTLVIGFLATASFFVYETTSNKYTRDFKKEITSATKVFKQDKNKNMMVCHLSFEKFVNFCVFLQRFSMDWLFFLCFSLVDCLFRRKVNFGNS